MTNPCPKCVETIADWLASRHRAEYYAHLVRAYFLPKSPVQQLAEECPYTDKAKVIEWVLDREAAKAQHHPLCSIQKSAACDYDCGRDYTHTDAAPRKITEAESVSLHNALIASVDSFEPPIEVSDAAPRYVFGPWEFVEDEHFPLGAAFQVKSYNDVIDDHVHNSTIRRAYRLGQSYEHDGGECPLADGSVRCHLMEGDMVIYTNCPAKDVSWEHVTSFTPLDQGSGQ